MLDAPPSSTVNSNFVNGTFNSTAGSFVCIMSKVASLLNTASGGFNFGNCILNAAYAQSPGGGSSGSPSGAGGGGASGSHGGSKRDRVRIRMRMIYDDDAHPHHNPTTLTPSEKAQATNMLQYTTAALSNTEIDAVTSTVEGYMSFNLPYAVAQADYHSLNVVISTTTPAGKNHEGTSTQQAPWIAFIDIQAAHQHMFYPLWTNTMLHECVHILIRSGSEVLVDSLAAWIAEGFVSDTVKNGARGREFTIP